MSLIRWDPHGDVDTLFNRLMSGAFLRSSSAWSPSADVSETDKEYLIRAELPAVKKEDVQVTLDQGVITIKGERKQTTDDENEQFHRIESLYGSFERSFSLPENIDADAIRCESKDGILCVRIPKSETQKQQPKQINVQ